MVRRGVNSSNAPPPLLKTPSPILHMIPKLGRLGVYRRTHYYVSSNFPLLQLITSGRCCVSAGELGEGLTSSKSWIGLVRPLGKFSHYVRSGRRGGGLRGRRGVACERYLVSFFLFHPPISNHKLNCKSNVF